MVFIIGVVVDGGLGDQLVKSLHKAALAVHVGEAERPGELGHPLGRGPLLNRLEQGVHHLFVVDKIDKPEACFLFTDALIDHTVDDSGDAPGGLAVAEGHVVDGLAKLKSRVLAGPKRVDFIGHQRRHIVGVAGIKGVDGERDKRLELAFNGTYFPDFYCHNAFKYSQSIIFALSLTRS